MEIMDQLTWPNLLLALAVVIVIAGAVTAIWKGVESWRKLSRTEEKKAAEDAQNKAIAALSNRISKCEERLARGDVQFQDTRTDMTQVLTVLNVILMHLISGNDNTKLKEVKNELDSYLAQR